MNFTNNNYVQDEERYFNDIDNVEEIEFNKSKKEQHVHKYMVYKKIHSMSNGYFCFQSYSFILRCIHCGKTKKVKVTNKVFNAYNKKDIYNK